MTKVALADAALHLRVDGADEYTLISSMLAAAYLAVEGILFRKVYDTPADIPAGDTTGIATNDAINAAALLILGHLYANREAVTTAPAVTVPMGAQWLLVPYIHTGQGF